LVTRTVQAPQQAMMRMACQGALRKSPAVDEQRRKQAASGAVFFGDFLFRQLKESH